MFTKIATDQDNSHGFDKEDSFATVYDTPALKLINANVPYAPVPPAAIQSFAPKPTAPAAPAAPATTATSPAITI